MVSESDVSVYAGGPGAYSSAAPMSPSTATAIARATTGPVDIRFRLAFCTGIDGGGHGPVPAPIAGRNPPTSSGLTTRVFTSVRRMTARLRSVTYHHDRPSTVVLNRP